MKIGWVIFETVVDSELTPGYQVIAIDPKRNETFEAEFKAVCPKGFVYKGVFETREEAFNWANNWRGHEANSH
jgi:hypothetical protein